MKIVIDVPEEYYNDIKSISDETSTSDVLLIKYATPLSEVLEDIKAEMEKLKEEPNLDKWAEYLQTCDDCVSRERVDSILSFWRSQYDGIDRAIDDIKELPSVQPTRKRCEDCKHYRPLYLSDEPTKRIGKCDHHWGFCPLADWYCNDFEGSGE